MGIRQKTQRIVFYGTKEGKQRSAEYRGTEGGMITLFDIQSAKEIKTSIGNVSLLLRPNKRS